MYLKLFYLLILCVCLHNCASAQTNPACSTVTFQKEIIVNPVAGIEYRRTFNYASETLDGNFIITGKMQYWYTNNPGHIFYDSCFVSKIDKSGNTLWFKSFKDSIMGLPNVISLPDSTFLLSYSFNNYSDTDESAFTRLDKNGNFIWQKKLRKDEAGSITSVSHTKLLSDGNLLAFGNGDYGLFALKLDVDGNLIWNANYAVVGATGVGNTQTTSFPNMAIERDDGYIILFPFIIITNNNLEYQAQFFKVNKNNGNVIWAKSIAEQGMAHYGTSIFNNQDDFIITSYSFKLFSLEKAASFFKLDENGNLLQNAKFNIRQNNIGVAKMNDGIIACIPDTSSNTITPVSIVQLSNNLTIDWAKKYEIDIDPTTISSSRPRILQTADNSVYTFLNRKSSSGNISKTYLIKTDLTGNTGTCNNVPINMEVQRPQIIVSNMSMLSHNENYLVSGDTLTFSNHLATTSTICQRTTYCDTININGSHFVCNLTDSNQYLIYRNASCFTSPIWHLADTSYGSIIVYSDTSIKIKFNRTGQTYLYATIPTECGVLKDSMLINIFEPANTLNLGADVAVCGDTTTLLDAGAGFKNYSWQDGSTNQTFVSTAPGIYYVTVTDFCDNIFRDSVVIAASAPENIDIGNDIVICRNDSTIITAPNGFNNYEWQPDYNIVNNNVQQAIFFPSVTTKYFLYATKSPGCIAVDSITIQVKNLPTLQLPADTSICAGNTFILDAGPGVNEYAWNTGQTVSQINISQAGTYILSVRDVNGCKATDTFSLINVLANPVVDIGNETFLCEGATKTLSAGNNTFYSYLWQDGSSLSDFIISDTGFYKVLVTDISNGCIGSDSIYISQLIKTPGDFLPADTTICIPSTINISSLQNFESYNWSTGNTGKMISITQPGTYSLEVKDNYNCIGIDVIIVKEKNCSRIIYFPSAFTPNGDGLNDIFRPIISFMPVSFKLSIFNRYGETVFTTTDPLSGWNGMYKGSYQNTGGYTWIAQYQFTGEPIQQQKGTVTLIR